MNMQQQLAMMATKARLSTLWIFVLLNMVFRDIHELPGLIEEMLTVTANGTQITEELMLLAGMLLEIPIAMVILSRVVPYRLNRWANIFAALIFGTLSIASGTNDLDDIWFLAIEIVGLIAIIWSAWRWPQPTA